MTNTNIMKRLLLLFAILLLSGCDDFFEEDISDKAPEIVAPVDGAETGSGEITFLWRSMGGARGYHLTIVSPGFDRAARVVADTIMRNDTISEKLSYKHILEEGEYQWRLQGINQGYESEAGVYSLLIAGADEGSVGGGEEEGEEGGED